MRTGRRVGFLAAGVCAFALLCVVPSTAEAGVITFDAVTNATPGIIHPDDANFNEDGGYVEAFWAEALGTAGGAHVGGHFHNNSSNEAQHLNGSDQLQGFFLETGGTFDLLSLDYNVSFTASIDGFDSTQVYVLLATSFDPTGTAAGAIHCAPNHRIGHAEYRWFRQRDTRVHQQLSVGRFRQRGVPSGSGARAGIAASGRRRISGGAGAPSTESDLAIPARPVQAMTPACAPEYTGIHARAPRVVTGLRHEHTELPHVVPQVVSV